MTHGYATPLCDSGPSLNAEMRGNLLLLRHRLQLGIGEHPWCFDQATDPQPKTLKTSGDQRVEFGRIRHGAVWPEIRGNVLLGQLAVWVPPFGHSIERPHHDLADPLNEARMPNGEWGGQPPSHCHECH